MRHTHLWFYSGAASLAVMAQAPACAQESAETGAGPMEDIVVTARRREERLQDVPVAVTAIGGEALEQRAIRETEDLRYAVPSLQVAPTPFGAAVPGYSIRGRHDRSTAYLRA